MAGLEDQFNDMLEQFQREVRTKLAEMGDTKQTVDAMMGFFHAIDWTERWLQGVLFIELLLLVLTLWTRKRQALQMCIFLVAASLTFLAERINSWCAANWQRFATQDYFDKHGVFMSAILSGPMLVIAIATLINYMLMLVSLMVKWKRAELKHKAKKAAKED